MAEINVTERTHSRKLRYDRLPTGGEPAWYDMPHEELVAIIKDAVAVAGEEWERKWGKGSFDPIVWIGEKLTGRTFFASDTKPLRLSLAWDAISEPHMKSAEYRSIVRGILRDSSRIHGRQVTLEPKGVKLLDAMAEAVGIPRKRGESTVGLLSNVAELRRLT